MRIGVTKVLQAHQLDNVFHPLVDLFFGQLFQLQPKAQVFLHRLPGNRGRLLKHKGQIVLFGVGGLSVDQKVALGWHVNAGQQVENRGLTAAGRAHNTDKFTLSDIKGDVVEHVQIPKIFCEVLNLHLVFTLWFAHP